MLNFLITSIALSVIFFCLLFLVFIIVFFHKIKGGDDE
jgi:hypothetical protein